MPGNKAMGTILLLGTFVGPRVTMNTHVAVCFRECQPHRRRYRRLPAGRRLEAGS